MTEAGQTEPQPGPSAPQPRTPTPGGPRRLRLGAVVAIVVVVAVGAWLLLRDGDGDSSNGSSLPSAATASDLRELAGGKDIPVYWAGARPGFSYELTETDKGNIFIRYLPPGVKIGDRRPNFLTIGTYPYENAYETLLKAGARPGASMKRIAGGGIVVTSEQNPKSVYLALPKQNYQVEVYDPSPARAQRLATSGRVRPIL